MLLARSAGTETVREYRLVYGAPLVGSASDRACLVAPPVLCGIFLSLPFGIVAMLFALRSRALLAEGAYEKASAAKRRAAIFAWVSIASAAFKIILFLLLTTG